jgi:hypothetical protein
MCQEFKYFGTTATNQHCIHEEIKSRLNLGNVCYPSVQSFLSSHLLSKNIKIKICRTIILPVVSYGCETWSLKLREEHRLRIFENRMLRRIFGPKREEVVGGWRGLHNEEPCNLYASPNVSWVMKSRRMRWVGQVACMGEERREEKCKKTLVEKPEGKRPRGRSGTDRKIISQWILGT